MKIELYGQEVEQVSKFVYLGELITGNGQCEEEILRRIKIARKFFPKMRTVLTNPKLSIISGILFIKCYVWSTLLCRVKRAGTSKSLFGTDQIRKLSFLAHIMRQDSLQWDLIEYTVEGKRGRGRPRLQWSDNITQ